MAEWGGMWPVRLQAQKRFSTITGQGAYIAVGFMPGYMPYETPPPNDPRQSDICLL